MDTIVTDITISLWLVVLSDFVIGVAGVAMSRFNRRRVVPVESRLNRAVSRWTPLRVLRPTSCGRNTPTAAPTTGTAQTVHWEVAGRARILFSGNGWAFSIAGA